MQEYENLRKLIAAALDGSIDDCARCKTCDNQVNAVVDVITNENARRVIAEAMAASFENAGEALLKVTVRRDVPGEVTVVMNADHVVGLKEDDTVRTVRLAIQIPGGDEHELGVMAGVQVDIPDFPPDPGLN